MSNPRVFIAGPQSFLRPTYHGFIRTTSDVFLLLGMCLNGRLCHVPRRPYPRERPHTIQSGNVFIYEEDISGIQQWTDGINWSPSYILGDFLIYRETEPGLPRDAENEKAIRTTLVATTTTGSKPEAAAPRFRRIPDPVDYERLCLEDQELYGQNIHSYSYKPDGLVKKTTTVSVEGVFHHLVSYYTAEAVRSGRLQTPTGDPQFCGINPRIILIRDPSLQIPLEQEEFRMLRLGRRRMRHLCSVRRAGRRRQTGGKEHKPSPQ
ncbi:Gti1/Pac2 family-domain-containing protein [Coniochaeta sp. 2T2.1]|nr:Gti1/Pac2 family-domain-containing protein [Coniochaeta sp. 2T2.1]